MNSMTGYAYQEIRENKIFVSCEIKSYNSRFLDLQVHLPPWLSVLETDIRKYISSRFGRGKIDVYIRVKNEDESFTLTLNKTLALSYKEAAEDLASSLGLDEKPGLNLILGLEGVAVTDIERDAELYRTMLNETAARAADMLETERRREGEHTKSSILSHLDILEAELEKISIEIPEMEDAIKINLKKRFAELLGDSIDENRILTETASQLVKYSVSEEISRLTAHLKEFRKETEENPAPGKKLDFLSQEINREINTIGSKTPVLDVSRSVVDMKNALENIREQLRNVE